MVNDGSHAIELYYFFHVKLHHRGWPPFCQWQRPCTAKSPIPMPEQGWAIKARKLKTTDVIFKILVQLPKN
jgi:hypothetical protein